MAATEGLLYRKRGFIMVLSCNHIHKYFTDHHILNDATFHVDDYERVALVGINGAGKTTLLRILVGELPADDGDITIGKGKTIGYLPQQQGYHSDKSIYDELLTVKAHIIELDKQIRETQEQMKHAEGSELETLLKRYSTLQTDFEKQDGYAYQSQVMGVINGLGFSKDDVNKCINTLSGGQKTRVALGKLLLTAPDLLIMDEPTNHLDLDSINWLETYLSNYKGSVLVVSHDRYFLDRIADKVVEVEHGQVRMFKGNYSDYAIKKEALREAMLNQYYNQQREIKHQEQVIEKLRSFNREKSIKRAESRVKMLDKIERIDKPIAEEKAIHFQLNPGRMSGNDVLNVSDLAKSFGDNHLFSHVSYEIKRGEKVAIIGKNGTGKTTMLKILNQFFPADEGEFRLGANVTIGYYDQEHNVLSPEKTIFDEIHDDYPDLDNTTIRNVLAAFLFTEDDVFKSISLLSGGEKGRVSLAKLMLSEANFLLLDEPTNHLDIASKEILEDAINNYTGTVLYVSHDRYFINKTATRILDLTHEQLLSYDGNYSYYLEKKDLVEGLHIKEETIIQENETSESKLDWKQQKQEQAKRRKLENQYQALEQEMEQLDTKNASIDQELQLPENASNVAKLMELSTAKEEVENRLLEILEEMDELEKLM